jgi:UDP-N-acetylglucosamine 2-epimerase (non-hydrolysing)
MNRQIESDSMQILHVVGARPNFMKAAPLLRALASRSGVGQTLVHTGQHYDVNMSAVFFQELGMPQPDVNLQVGSSSQARQIAEIMIRIEPVLLESRPDWVLVYGDVNSTVAAAVVCAKIGIPVAHVEAGLRSFDRSMPEEINRIITDQLADLLFTPSQDGNENLAREGIAPDKVRMVGNVMVDTLVCMLAKAGSALPAGLPDRYALVTLHRPANVDDVVWLGGMLDVLGSVSESLPVLFPMHPRTRQKIADADLTMPNHGWFHALEPQSYLTFLALQQHAAVVITDSGGIQEETTFLGVPCITVRENTERPVTVDVGTNVLVGRDVRRILVEVKKVLGGNWKSGLIPPLWDGHTAERIADVLLAARPYRSCTASMSG